MSMAANAIKMPTLRNGMRPAARLRRSRLGISRAKYSFRGARGLLVVSTAIAVGTAYVYAPMVAAALLAMAFMLLAYMWPLAAMSLILALSPIQNDLGAGGSPVRFAPAELLMFLSLPAVLWRMAMKPRIGLTLFPVLVYLAVCVVASRGEVRSTTIVSMLQMVLYLIIAVIVFSNLSDRPASLAKVFDLYIGSATLISLIGLATNFTFLGTQKNGWGASLSTALVVAIDQWFAADSKRRRQLLIGAMIVISGALVMTVSRGGWIAAIAGTAVVCTLRGQLGGMLKALMLLATVALTAWLFLPQNLRDYAFGFDAGRENIRLRYVSVDYALSMWHRDPLLGVGVGLRKEYDATNIVLLTLAETGWAGLIAFLAVHLTVLYISLKTISRARPNGAIFSFAVLASALLTARFAHGLVDHYWSRGPITCAWAAVGLATLGYQAMRNSGARPVGMGERIYSRAMVINRVHPPRDTSVGQQFLTRQTGPASRIDELEGPAV